LNSFSDSATPGHGRPNSPSLLLLAAIILVWGSNWPIMKIGLQSIPPLTFAAVRLGTGAVCLFAVLAVLGRLRLPERRDYPVIFSVGIIQMAVFLILVNLGLSRVDAGRSAILAYTTMLWVTPAAVLFLGERLSLRKTLGLLAGLAGVGVMFNPLSFDWEDAELLMGNALLMAAALCWAIAILHVRAHDWRARPLDLAPWQLLAGFVVVLPVALWFEADLPIHWSATLVGVLAYNGPIATGFAIWAWVSINRALPAITTSIGSLGVPAVGVLASALVLDEAFSVTNLLGLAFIVTGLAVISLDPEPGGRAVGS
jgi:drug/metabolite transporter (DMT)-like permease